MFMRNGLKQFEIELRTIFEVSCVQTPLFTVK